MPTAPFLPCRASGCPGYQVAGTGYCATHRSLSFRWAPSRGNDNPVTRPCNRHFRRLRRAWLMRNPLCVNCGDAGTILDHIRPHEGNLDLFWSQANWQTLCKPCHDRKTREEIGGRLSGFRPGAMIHEGVVHAR